MLDFKIWTEDCKIRFPVMGKCNHCHAVKRLLPSPNVMELEGVRNPSGKLVFVCVRCYLSNSEPIARVYKDDKGAEWKAKLIDEGVFEVSLHYKFTESEYVWQRYGMLKVYRDVNLYAPAEMVEGLRNGTISPFVTLTPED